MISQPIRRILAASLFLGAVSASAENAYRAFYLYPTEPSEVRVQVMAPQGVTHSEPAYGDGWQVLAQPDGRLKPSESRKEYSQLFWEGWLAPVPNPSRIGAVVAQADVKAFFQKTLLAQGLEEPEINDFLDAWLIRFTVSAYYRIRFFRQEEIDVMAPLVIEPKPETVIRVLFEAERLGAPEMSSPQEFPPRPERRGFTAVEWGGLADW